MTEHEANAAADGDAEIKRVPSHVPGLDAILCGGFLSGGVYLIEGLAGSGKTVLASQIIYSHAAQGSRALFVTVLGENHGRMMAHLRPMRFFDQSLVPDRVTYISAYQALEENKEGLRDLTALLAREVQAHGSLLLVLDGLSAVQEKAGSSFEMKRFTHELQALALATDCTMLLLTTPSGAHSSPEHTLVDGVIELQQRIYAPRSERRLLVHKTRGSGFLEGEHAFRISQDGITVFPRIEAQFINSTASDGAPRMRVSSGIASLDQLLHGGFPAATMAAVVGPTGAGKTTCGLQFLSASSAAEPGLLFGCYRSPHRLRLKAEMMKASALPRRNSEARWKRSGTPSASMFWMSLPTGCWRLSSGAASSAWSSTEYPAFSNPRSSRSGWCGFGPSWPASSGHWASPPCTRWSSPGDGDRGSARRWAGSRPCSRGLDPAALAMSSFSRGYLPAGFRVQGARRGI